MTPRIATALKGLRLHTPADVVFDGDVLVIVRVDPDVCGSQFLIIDEDRLNLAEKPTGHPKRRDHLRVVP
jgi:hypothetical protein